jgi:hypothetical protein
MTGSMPTWAMIRPRMADSPMVVIVPPMKEPMAATASAGPARPCLAIW